MFNNPGGDWHPGRGDNPIYRGPTTPFIATGGPHLEVIELCAEVTPYYWRRGGGPNYVLMIRMMMIMMKKI